MEIVEIWQSMEKNATQIMIFLPHHMWAENKNALPLHWLFAGFLVGAFQRKQAENGPSRRHI